MKKKVLIILLVIVSFVGVRNAYMLYENKVIEQVCPIMEQIENGVVDIELPIMHIDSNNLYYHEDIHTRFRSGKFETLHYNKDLPAKVIEKLHLKLTYVRKEK
ncbi:hypothetical protein RJG79_07440 [Mycoplasmatota bacterium WC44]